MFKDHSHEQVESRNEPFVERFSTKIWKETPSAENPYITDSVRCYGYDLLELSKKRSFVDVFFLLFKGELPTPNQSALLEQLMITLVSPSLRHPAMRAAMNAGVGKSLTQHILPISLGVLSGDYLGVGSIEQIMRMFRSSSSKPVDECIALYLSELQKINTKNTDEINEIIPGFGRIYGGRDALTLKIATQLNLLAEGSVALSFALALNRELEPFNLGLLPSGLAAAVFSDLGFHPRMGVALFQLLSAPGLAAQGLEIANKPITAMPFVPDDHYFIER